MDEDTILFAIGEQASPIRLMRQKCVRRSVDSEPQCITETQNRRHEDEGRTADMNPTPIGWHLGTSSVVGNTVSLRCDVRVIRV